MFDRGHEFSAHTIDQGRLSSYRVATQIFGQRPNHQRGDMIGGRSKARFLDHVITEADLTLSMGKLLARLARNFSRKFVARRVVAVCFVLRRRDWNSASVAILNQHLPITHPIQTLCHAILPYARPSKDQRLGKSLSDGIVAASVRSDKPCGGRDRYNLWLPEPQERSALISSRGCSRTPGGAWRVSGRCVTATRSRRPIELRSSKDASKTAAASIARYATRRMSTLGHKQGNS